MNLVADDADVVALTDVVHALQLLAGPYATGWVVRVAKQEHRALLVGTLALEVIPVDGVGEERPTPTPSQREGSVISIRGCIIRRKGI